MAEFLARWAREELGEEEEEKEERGDKAPLSPTFFSVSSTSAADELIAVD